MVNQVQNFFERCKSSNKEIAGGWRGLPSTRQNQGTPKLQHT